MGCTTGGYGYTAAELRRGEMGGYMKSGKKEETKDVGFLFCSCVYEIGDGGKWLTTKWLTFN